WGYQGALAWGQASPVYGERFSVWQRHAAFASDYLRARAAGRDRPLSVYWIADLRYLWFEARVHSYFNTVQLSGCVYNRGTALEGRRRADLVGPFEVEELRRTPLAEPWQSAMLCLFGLPEGTEPTPEGLLRLCGDEGLDFVVLERPVAGIPCASDGKLYIFDCGQLRRLR